MSKHTPGPWHYQEASDAYTHIVRNSKGGFIAHTPQRRTGEDEANARLIAAAPELLSALKEYAIWKGAAHEEDCSADDTCQCSGKSINDAVNAAIAKAEGNAEKLLATMG